MNPEELIDFEIKIGNMFNTKQIKAPIHLYHGNEEKMIEVSYRRAGQDVRYSLDDSKLRAIGWRPKVEFDKELKEIVEYYKNKFIW